MSLKILLQGKKYPFFRQKLRKRNSLVYVKYERGVIWGFRCTPDEVRRTELLNIIRILHSSFCSFGLYFSF